MDMPIPIKSEQVEKIPNGTGEQAYKYYVLDRIDGSDIPENVKQFAKNNNCNEVMKSYYWTYTIYKNKGGIYFCDKNNKFNVIYDNSKKPRFAKWYEKHKFKTPITEF